MSATRYRLETLFSTLPFAQFTGRLRSHVDLSRTNWFRVGGPADFLFKPEHTADLSAFLSHVPHDIPVMVLGVGSNLIVRDGGLEGVVIKLGRGFADITAQGVQLVAGAAALDVHVATVAGEHGIAGFEFLSGIPGTLGGAVRMNAGAYGSDMAQVFERCEMVERDGAVRQVDAQEIGFVYRHSALPEGAIVTRVWMKGYSGIKETILARMKEIQDSRESTQPVRSRTGGSTFKNPEGYKAWELVDKAGCRGLKRGGAQVSELHCNFLINTGDATAADLEALGEEVRRRVKDATGVMLEWEIKRIGKS